MIRTLCIVLTTSFSIYGQKVDEQRIRLEYALEFTKRQHLAYDDIERRLWKQPYSLGDEFECPNPFRIYKIDCPGDTFSLDTDMSIDVPIKTKIRLTGKEVIGKYTLYEIRVELTDRVVRTYILSNKLDDVFFPENHNDRESLYNDFKKRDNEIKQKLMEKFNVTEESLHKILKGWDI